MHLNTGSKKEKIKWLNTVEKTFGKSVEIARLDVFQ